MSNETEKAYSERNRLMVLAAVLALNAGHRVGRYRDPDATEERFAWIVQIELGVGKGQQVTVHIDAHDIASGWRLLPEIERDWDGHDADEAFARVGEFVEYMIGELRDGRGLRAELQAATRRAAAVEHGASIHLQASAAELEQERRESARLRAELRQAQRTLRGDLNELTEVLCNVKSTMEKLIDEANALLPQDSRD